jgi:hypothetical protein
VWAEAVWGPRIKEKAHPLNVLLNELALAIQSHFQQQDPDRRQTNEDGLADQRRDRMFSWQAADEDKFRKRLDGIIDEIEVELKPHIVGHHR